MADEFKHLRLHREVSVNTKRTRQGGYRGGPEPDDRAVFGEKLKADIDTVRQNARVENQGGFDDRLLVKITVAKGFQAEHLKPFQGVEAISQEGEQVLLAFASAKALQAFEAKLATIIKGNHATYENFVFAMDAFGLWTAADRMAPAFKREGLPPTGTFMLDVELWPVETAKDRTALVDAFKAWLAENRIEVLDSINRESLVLFRLKVNKAQAEALLRHRDVRLVDLPPRFGFSREVFRLDIDTVGIVDPPSIDAPAITILDTGVQSGHPLIAPAFGYGENFYPDDLDHEDVKGHGTQVAGIALYGDVHRCIQNQRFVPTFWIYSGRVLDASGFNATGLVHNHIIEAVTYFATEHQCRIFNLSFGDLNKPYTGGHVRGLAVVLDQLARELNVLFVVSAGNFHGECDPDTGDHVLPADWAAEYPGYLALEEVHIIDPAPALNVLTVGSIARWDQSFDAQRYPTDPNYRPIAKVGQPSPFTRCGPSVGGAIKPELVDFGGNKFVVANLANALRDTGLGEISTVMRGASGALVGADCGTSFAAPHVAHHAATFLVEYPDASPDLIRAMLVASARPPAASIDLFGKDEERRRKICGYGQVCEGFSRSTQREVTLLAEDFIENRKHHFYEVPVPVEFYSAGRRRREITVALAHTPRVRTNRIAYKATRISFKVVEAASLEDVERQFDATTPDGEYKRIDEWKARKSVGEAERAKGTVQASTFTVTVPSPARLKRKLFVVVTRNDFPWASDFELCDQEEPYALVIRISDREAGDTDLFTKIEAQVKARVKQHEQADLRARQRASVAVSRARTSR